MSILEGKTLKWLFGTMRGVIPANLEIYDERHYVVEVDAENKRICITDPKENLVVYDDKFIENGNK